MTEHETMRATTSALVSLSKRGAKRDYSIRIRGLQHYYGEGELKKQVLYDNQLDVLRGEIVIMTGPSGSGKTTLLTLIGTLRTAQVGVLRVLGHELQGAPPKKLVDVRRELGFIFQAHNLFESLTAFQNVRMAMELFSYSDADMKRRTEEMLSRLGLGSRIHYKPGSLSGGQKQRVAIARGLVHKPKLVLADEPTAALDDEKSGREVVTLFQQLAREEGVLSILMVTHDNRILDVADRIVNMVDGRIKSDVFLKEVAVICEFLSRCPAFSTLTPRTLTEVADKLLVEEHRAGTVVIRQGDPGDKFYLIRQGSVDVEVRTGDTMRIAATLGEGDFFGETALLTGAPRNASVVTKEDAILYALGKDDFNGVLRSSASFQDELRKAIFERQ